MWIADQWNDYEVLDTSRGENAGALGRLPARAPGSTGHLGYAKKAIRLEASERPLSPQQAGRR